jgi:hypothetical protein
VEKTACSSSSGDVCGRKALKRGLWSQFLGLHNGFFHCVTMTTVFVSGSFAGCLC